MENIMCSIYGKGKIMITITKDQAQIIRSALIIHDGPSLVPGWPREKQKELTYALDALRLELLGMCNKSDGTNL